ncbi:MAG: sigma-54 dependent transcriptional regulator [candidate division Zixibacteria bacterium]
MDRKPEILIIDDDKGIVDSLSSLYKDNGYNPTGARTGDTALSLAERDRFDLIILDLDLPDIYGVELLKMFRAQKIETPVIIVSGKATISAAIEATKLGAFNVIEKPPDPAQLLLDSKIAIKQRSLEAEVESLRRSLLSQNYIVGESEIIKTLRDKLRRVASSDSKVYILGEPGVGKELAARYLHFSSKRAAGPFVAVNCAAIPGELFESELFGHERGAFTGAVSRQQGKFEVADGGTLFLDEVGELRPDHQAKLLRAIESSSIQRVGSSKEVRIDVRVMAASNKDLQTLTREGKFREDLYFRLNVIPVYVPPLKDRLDDIPLLTRRFLDDLGFERLRIEPGALSELSSYDWPGNVRELKNIVERTAALIYGDTISAEDISEALKGAQGGRDYTKPEQITQSLSLRDHLSRYEKSLLEEVMRDVDGNITKAAKTLKMDRGNLSKKLKGYGLTGK